MIHQFFDETKRIQNAAIVPLEHAVFVQYVDHAVITRQHFNEVKRRAIGNESILSFAAIQRFGQLHGGFLEFGPGPAVRLNGLPVNARFLQNALVSAPRPLELV
ncbi:hypothetical protein D1872_256940 [compost metagenome]